MPATPATETAVMIHPLVLKDVKNVFSFDLSNWRRVSSIPIGVGGTTLALTELTGESASVGLGGAGPLSLASFPIA